MSDPYNKATNEAILKTELTNPSYTSICEWINWLYGPERITGETHILYSTRMSIYGEGYGAYGDIKKQNNNRITIGCRVQT
jgi:hypothetical protein